MSAHIVAAPGTPAAVTAPAASAFSWSAAAAGVVIASAMSLLLLGFGAAIGLSLADPTERGDDGPSLLAGALYMSLVYLFSIAVGAYFAGRLRPRVSLDEDEARFRDGADGLVTWAGSLLIGAFIAGAALTGAAQTVGSVAMLAAPTAVSVAEPLAEKAADDLLRLPAASGPASDASANAASANAATADSGADADARPAPVTRTSVARDETMGLEPEQREQATRILLRGLIEGELSESDRAYLSRLLEDAYGYDAEQAREAVAARIDAAQAAAAQALEEAQEATAFLGFWSAATLLLAGMAAWFAATLGGSHRDDALAVAAAVVVDDETP